MNATAAGRAARIGAAGLIGAAALTGALALTACDSGGGSGSPSHSPSGARSGGDITSTAPGATGSAGAGTGGAAKEAPLSGSWLATTGGREVVLIVNSGKAALFSTARTTCAGSASEQGGKQVLRLAKCGDRTTGTVDSVNRTTLRVTWEGGLGRETYTRADGGTVPSGLPTASLGS